MTEQGADGALYQGERVTSFVDYLRAVVAGGGFLVCPAEAGERDWRTKGAEPF